MNLWERITKMFRGYTRSYRRKYESAYAKRGLLYFGAVDWLIGKAQWTNDEETERGSLLTSLNALSDEWKLSVKQVRLILDNLKEDDFITTEKMQHHGMASKGKGLKIIIKNYDVYQSEYLGGHDKGHNDRALSDSLQGVDSVNTYKEEKENEGTMTGHGFGHDELGARAIKKFKRINNNNRANIINTYSSLNNIYNINNKQNYPTDISEVKKEAEKICYAISDEQAQAFIDHYSTLGWRLQGGGYIVDWTKLLPRWKNNELNRKGKDNAGNRKNNQYDDKNVGEFKDSDATTDITF